MFTQVSRIFSQNVYCVLQIQYIYICMYDVIYSVSRLFLNKVHIVGISVFVAFPQQAAAV